MTRSLEDAQHEAAHLVVGVAVGMRLIEAVLRPRGDDLGYTWFYAGTSLQENLMSAAGIAWERQVGDLVHARGDFACLRAKGVRAYRTIRALEVAAWAILRERAGAHVLVTRALLERDLTGRDVARLARGERV